MNNSAIDTLEATLESKLNNGTFVEPVSLDNCVLCGMGISSRRQLEHPTTDVCELCAEGDE